MNKLILYGDSNTYGYDPRNMMAGRLPEDIRWATKVVHALKETYEVREEGLNGRQLPVSRSGRISRFLENMVADLGAGDVIMMMLGTNDVLLTNNPKADPAIDKMRTLLDWYKSGNYPFKLIITAPVPIADINEEMNPYHRESLIMNAGFKELCTALDIDFIDAGEWDISLAYDGVHIAEEGQEAFAEGIIKSLTAILNKEN